MITLYEVTVYNITNGDVEQYLPEATQEELDSLRDWYEDEPWFEIIIDREWEEEEE